MGSDSSASSVPYLLSSSFLALPPGVNIGELGQDTAACQDPPKVF